MVDMVCKRLRLANKQCSVVGLAIGYSKNVGGGFYHVMKLDAPTDSSSVVLDCCLLLFDRFYSGLPIRKVGVSIGKLSNKDSLQLNIFDDYEKVHEEEVKDKTIDYITNKFGKNSILRASALLEDSTVQERNKKIGGHNA